MVGVERWDPMAAVRAMVRAEDAVDDAVRLLLDAEAVHWTGRGSAAYRRLLEDATHAVRRSRTELREATGAVADHAAVPRSGLGSTLGPGTVDGAAAWPPALRPAPTWAPTWAPSWSASGTAPP